MSESMLQINHPSTADLRGILNRIVVVHLFDDTTFTGILHKTTDPKFHDILELRYNPNHYCLAHLETKEPSTCIFRVSHIEYVIVLDLDDASIIQHIMMELSSHWYPEHQK